MLKFLRVHNKKILVFAGAILMVLFLLPQAWQSMAPNAQDQVAFRIDDRKFTGHDMSRAQARLVIIMGLQQTAGITLFGFPIEGLEHWMLLVHEAKRQGLVGGGSRIDELVAAIADVASRRFAQYGTDPAQQAQYVAQMRDAILAALDNLIEEERDRVGTEVLEQAVAEIFGVQRLLELTQAFTTFSAPEIDTVAVQHLDTAIADISLVEYLEVLGEVSDPTEEQLAAHFEQFKDVEPSTDGATMGYRQTPAVQLEAVEVDLSRIRAALVIDEIEVNKRWRQNKATYGEDFGAARDRVEGEIRDERLDGIEHSLEEVARRELFRETKDLATDSAPKELPVNWADTRVSFDGLAEAFNAEVAKSVSLPSPAATVTRIDTWTTETELGSRSLGRAFATIRGQPVALPVAVMQVRELAPESNAGLRVGIAFGPLMTPKEKLAFVRVMAVRPAGPPASIDEVRDQVVADWKKLRAFEKLQERTEEIRRVVADAGRIDAILGAYTRPLMQVGVEVNRSGATIAGNTPATVANTQAMRDAILDVVAKWEPTIDPATLPAPDRVVVVALPDQFGVGAAIITGRYPVTQEVVRTYMPQLRQRYSFELSSEGNIEAPYSFESMKRRLGYKVPERAKRPTDETEDELPTPT